MKGHQDQIVFVVDDDGDHAVSIQQLLSSVSLRVELFANGDDFLQRITADDAGCALIDVRLPGMSGLELQERINAVGIEMPVIIMTAYGDIPIVVAAFQQGAIDFIEKPYNPTALIDRVNGALRKDRIERAARLARQDVVEQLSGLTKREREVLDGLINGQATKQIARVLGIGLTTVDFHRSNILQKMDVDSVPLLVKNIVSALGENYREFLDQ